MNKILFHTSSYGYLVNDIFQDARMQNVDLGTVTIEKFPDGEIYHRIESDINDKEAYLLGGTINDAETMELYDIGCSLLDGIKGKGSVKSLTVIIPFFGYSTMERAVKDGELVKAKLRANLISSIGNIKLFLIDLHADGMAAYFDRNVHVIHLYSKEIIFEICQEIKDKDKLDTFVIGSTDAGRAKWVESLAKDMHVECAIITKRRISGSETQISNVNADVKNKTVIIYDDMIRTGGSLSKAARAYKKEGATKVYAIATHGIFPESSFLKLKKEGDIDGLYVTNTHPNSVNKEYYDSEFYIVKSVASLITKSVFEIYG